ncbi:MAG: phosphoribosylglycinamide formyltransferase [Luteibaculaceae bacterium]
MPNTKIAIFASGSGSNAEKILAYFKGHSTIAVVLICSNKSDAGVLEHAKTYQIPSLVFNKEEFLDGEKLRTALFNAGVNYIILAGFLWKIPKYMLNLFPEKIINIHPALLPKYGGKGMYGIHVHKAVLENKEQESGITIHLADEVYDNGKHLFQAKINVSTCTTAEEIAAAVLRLEHEHFPRVIENYISQ